jgi:DNA-binding transcriptional ArsR family regulator
MTFNMKETSAFLELIGDTPFTRLLDFLITGRNFDYTLSDLVRKAGLSWTTLNRTFPKLIKHDIVIQTRKVGMAKLYKLNTNNILVQKLVDIYMSILAEKLEHASKEQKLHVTEPA